MNERMNILNWINLLSFSSYTTEKQSNEK